MRTFIITIGVVLTAVLGVYLSFCYVSYTYPLEYKDKIENYANSYDLEPAFVASIINAESKFDAMAVSKKGAMGLMQILPSTAQFIAKSLNIKTADIDLFNPELNIMFGCYYLKYLNEKFDTRDSVIASYNAGEGNVKSWLLSSEYSSDGKVLKDIPFKETKDYVKKVNNNYKHYIKKF